MSNTPSAQSIEYKDLPVPTVSVEFPKIRSHQIETSFNDAEQALIELQNHKENWKRLAINQKIELLDALLHDLSNLVEEWVAVSLKAKGVHPGGFAEGEERFIFGGIIRLVRLLRESLSDRMKYGKPGIPGEPTNLANDQISVPTFPASLAEKIMFMGYHAETWLEPGVSPDEMFKDTSDSPGRIVLALGAGNNGSSSCADALHFLFVEGDVVALKMNPINDYLGPVIEKGFQCLIREGFLQILYGGADLGSYLCEHPLVEHIHLTGSVKTFERIIFGSGEEGAQRKAARASRLNKTITAELGCVNPAILVPGNWKEKDYRRAALMLATWLGSNAGYNCLTPRLIITHKNWPGRQLFLDAFRQILQEMSPRPAYYPGSQANRQKYLDGHPEAESYGLGISSSEADGTIETLPITFIAGLTSDAVGDVCYTNEPFGMLISETAIEADTPAEFLSRATSFANHHVWGTLSATLITPSGVESDADTRIAIQEAIADLQYGTICVNVFAGFVYATSYTPWGSFPNRKIDDIQSGIGFINNPLGLSNPQKTVFYAPFQRIDPVSIRNRFIVDFCRCYTDFQISPSIGKFLKVLWLAMRGSL